MSAVAGNSVDYEVIVVGGGLTGAAILRDCASRGLRALLVEADDLAAGASGLRAGVLDGGPRPLPLGRRGRVAAEVEVLRQTAWYLLSRRPVLWPMLEGESRSPLGPIAALRDTLAAQYPASPSSDAFWAWLERDEVRALEPAISPAVVGAGVTAAWTVDVSRLVAQNVRAAEAEDAEISTGCEVVDLLVDAGAVRGVVVAEHPRRRRRTIEAPVVILAAGAACAQLAALAGIPLVGQRVALVGIRLHRSPTRAVVALGGGEAGARVVPRGDHGWMGPFEVGPLRGGENPTCSPRTLASVLERARRLLPEIDRARILEVVVAGTSVELPDETAGQPSSPRLLEHTSEGVRGLLSAWGGLTAEKRWLAERVVDRTCGLLGREENCRTSVAPLPCDVGLAAPALWADQYPVTRGVVDGLVARHGGRAHEIMLSGEKHGDLPPVCRCQEVTGAEVREVCKREHAADLSSLARRTDLGRGPCQGGRCLVRATRRLYALGQLDAVELLAALRRAKDDQFQRGRPVLVGEGAPGFALDQLAHRLTGNLDAFWADSDGEGEGG